MTTDLARGDLDHHNDKIGLELSIKAGLTHDDLDYIITALTERATRLESEIQPTGDERKVHQVMCLDHLAHRFRLHRAALPLGHRVELVMDSKVFSSLKV